MADFMTTTQRSRAMSAVRGIETEIERTVRSHLHRKGFRFRKNVEDLPGRPDIVLPKHRCVIFVHGCFWHHHKECKRSKLPTTRRAFWSKKIGDNVKRDQRQTNNLRKEGWRVLTVWECELRDPKNQTRAVEKLIVKLTNGSN
ncbi:MAG: mismatch endonuclease, patch repair protein [Blastocatellia bacterium]|jgi:DNA mismatch endonuclease (patch repair protein)|nr:mismatch endonuclease, patch repair protein [Blastocatellia bacterium]